MTQTGEAIEAAETFPRKVRGTADPSASLGMTRKGRAMAKREQLPKEKASTRRD
jgi:hypothetical protein